MSDSGYSRRSTRREFLVGAGTGLVAGGIAGWGGLGLYRRYRGEGNGLAGYRQVEFSGRCTEIANPEFALPGPFPGKVIETHHPGSVADGAPVQAVVREMLARGMMELTGAPAPADAWRRFFERGDRVGIKVNPVGRSRKPGETGSISGFALIYEIVEALRDVGLGTGDVVLFERYANEFREAGYEQFLERELPGVDWYASAARGGTRQIDLEGRDRAEDGNRPDPDRHVLGYDPDVFRRFDYTLSQYDSHDGLSYQSHVSRIVTGDAINKIINIPTLKDHRSAGITIALKNLSHGLVSNVARTHAGRRREENRCGSFIPRVVELEPIRRKTVLHVVDGLVGVYEGGPGSWMRSWSTWERRSLFFATDPVAVDHVGRDILDAVRAGNGWAPVREMGIEGNNRSREETFYLRQPEHVELAGFLNLGVFDPSAIEYRRVQLPA